MTDSVFEVDKTTAPAVIKKFDGKIRIMFDDDDSISEIVVLSPDEKSSLVVTTIGNVLHAVNVPFIELVK